MSSSELREKRVQLASARSAGESRDFPVQQTGSTQPISDRQKTISSQKNWPSVSAPARFEHEARTAAAPPAHNSAHPRAANARFEDEHNRIDDRAPRARPDRRAYGARRRHRPLHHQGTRRVQRSDHAAIARRRERGKRREARHRQDVQLRGHRRRRDRREGHPVRRLRGVRVVGGSHVRGRGRATPRAPMRL